VGRPALFLDRDGTLIEDTGFVSDPRDVRPLPGAGEALRRAVDAGYLLVVISNQSGVARGLIDVDQLAAVDAEFRLQFRERFGIEFDAVLYCPHGPDDRCQCRKPEPGNLLRAAEELDIDLSSSLMIGDRPSDLEAGRAAGTRIGAVGFETDLDGAPSAPSLLELLNGVLDGSR
jgi:histidinol-phosphate phosphatase family protein